MPNIFALKDELFFQGGGPSIENNENMMVELANIREREPSIIWWYDGFVASAMPMT